MEHSGDPTQNSSGRHGGAAHAAPTVPRRLLRANANLTLGCISAGNCGWLAHAAFITGQRPWDWQGYLVLAATVLCLAFGYRQALRGGLADLRDATGETRRRRVFRGPVARIGARVGVSFAASLVFFGATYTPLVMAPFSALEATGTHLLLATVATVSLTWTTQRAIHRYRTLLAALRPADQPPAAVADQPVAPPQDPASAARHADQIRRRQRGGRLQRHNKGHSKRPKRARHGRR